MSLDLSMLCSAGARALSSVLTPCLPTSIGSA